MLQSSFFKQWQGPNRYNIFENLDTEIINLPDLLRRELSPDKLSQIAQVQPVSRLPPAVLGKVYYGVLKDGMLVIIKALRLLGPGNAGVLT